MAGLTLSREELEELTDLRQAKSMAAWLTARGWVFEPAHGRGIPKVDRAYYLARMSGTLHNSGPRERPRLDFLLNAATPQKR